MANLSDLAQPAINAPLGSGLARMAGSAINLDKLYKKYVTDAMSSGEEPLSKEEFAKTING